MKGQRLFVRPVVAADSDAIAELHAGSGEPIVESLAEADGLVGRLAGSTVAWLCWHRDNDSMVITGLLVAADVRRLGIGRMLLAEASKIAAEAGAASLRVEQDCKLARYFERCGFVSARGSLIRTTR